MGSIIEFGKYAEYVAEDDSCIGAKIKVKMADGQEIWMRRSDIEIVKKSSTEAAFEEKLKKSTVKKVIIKNDYSACMYKEPSITGDNVKNHFAKDTVLEFLEEKDRGFFGGQWVKARLFDGKEGYILKDYVEIKD